MRVQQHTRRKSTITVREREREREIDQCELFEWYYYSWRVGRGRVGERGTIYIIMYVAGRWMSDEYRWWVDWVEGGVKGSE